jgi:CubicO group peptidase (beta-lactamase class C family)
VRRILQNLRQARFDGVWFWIFAAVVAIAAAAAAVAPVLYRTAVLGSGFLAQRLCGDVFISKRDPDAVLAEDLSGPGYELLWFFQPRVDRERRLVTASAFGIGRQISVFREGFGCTHVVGKSEGELRDQTANLLATTPAPDLHALWPEGERVDLEALPQGVDGPALERAMDAAFAEPDPAHPRHTRALVVVYQGRIVAERYAPGFDAGMPLLGWSLTKAALNALVGECVGDGKLALGDRALLPEWQGSEDPRRDITLDELLRMTSGLAFDEAYSSFSSDITQMLFVQGDMAGFAASKPLIHPPGTVWHYSGGTSLILSRLLRNSFQSERDYLRFPRERLFDPLAMRSAVIEADDSGTLFAASFMYASARDWARLGLLFEQDGMWQGRRLLPEDWVAYTLTPASAAPDGRYGAHWLKRSPITCSATTSRSSPSSRRASSCSCALASRMAQTQPNLREILRPSSARSRQSVRNKSLGLSPIRCGEAISCAGTAARGTGFIIVRRFKAMFQSEMKNALDAESVRQAARAATRRCGFSPEALETLERTMDEVWTELAADGVAGGRALRNRLAQKLIAFACQGRADSQAKELLLRTFRNETLAALHAGHVPAKPWSAA